MAKIKVLIADDHSLVRQGLIQIISLEDDIEVVGEASDGEECVQKVKETKPDVVLLDINMPNVNGIKALRKIKDLDKSIKVIILTFHEEIEYLFETFNLGANGYIVKDAESRILIDGIREVNEGVSYVYPTMAEGDQQQLHKLKHIEQPKEMMDHKKISLTKREYEILTLIADGLNNREIANTLFISEKTVKNHVSNIFKKIQVSDRTQAAIYAFRNRIKSV
ncbi:DNA-binding response regulator, NarL/FixJ family, contains REC and HTH domains [Tindallia magadiensis]|uniref:Stage 0 sporulation protein A homolog n=1 Tax=Tindallia magadiensis TaxID=69895 RepID=A0A1I3B7U2_9FIRM|nr:response regulator transcription factor [Tindallia magadiensis]SFH58039.1 DNA-binding response regulator, NarL/FixJ family, contains REC and HTH domains [Tindallia magadiensis]